MSSKSNKELRDADPLGYLAAQMVVAAFTVAVTAAVAFILFFWNRPLGGPDDWGTFGDYFGGVVGALVAVATAGLVFLTLQATKREAESTRKKMEDQLDLLRKQQGLTDLHRKLEGAFEAWKLLTRVTSVKGQIGEANNRAPHMVESTFLAAIFRKAKYREFANYWRASLGETEVPNRLSASVSDARMLLIEFESYMRAYDQLSGSRVLGDFYRLRVVNAANVMYAWRMLPRDVLVRIEGAKLRLEDPAALGELDEPL